MRGQVKQVAQACGAAAVGVPHSAQNFAVGLRLALHWAQCLLVAVPHSGQNFAPAVISLWQLVQVIADGAAGAAAAGGAASVAGAGAACCAAAACWA
jgi:hypothetical protein